jgi:dTDP-4-dehydrorhamnose 3,5-epimerase
MLFNPTPIPGSFIVDPERKGDDRGFFARVYCASEFESHGLDPRVAQCNMSYNSCKGTLRGLHYETTGATKFIRCVRGAVFDVIVDLRPDSPTYLSHFGIELSQHNRRAFFVAAMCAHGYQALTDDAEVIYHVSEPYAPNCERGVHYNDPSLAIEWPLPVSIISEKDTRWPFMGTGPLSRGGFPHQEPTNAPQSEEEAG